MVSEYYCVCVVVVIRTFSFQASNGDNATTEEPDVAMLLA